MVKRGRSAAAARAPTRLGELNDITVHQHLTSDLAAESVRRAKRNGAGKTAFAAGLPSGHEQARLVAVLDSADLAFRRCDQIKL
jgi:hypothetical protein